MLYRMRRFLVMLFLAVCWLPASHAAGERVLRVAVLDNSPPMAFRDESGKLTGFSIEVIKALCTEISARCVFQVISLDQAVNALASGQADIAGMSLLSTPERRRKILFTQSYFRSVSLWFAKPGLAPGDADARVSVVKGSVQESFAVGRGWQVVPVPSNTELLAPLVAGQANAALVPMSSGLNIVQQPEMAKLKLSSVVMSDPVLGGDVSFGVAPNKPELKAEIDKALVRIKRNGVYDRLNSRFFPIRVN